MSTSQSPTFRWRPAAGRLHTAIGWLNSYHSFSFGHHHDPLWMGHRSLRVINDDVVAPGAGFDWHSHRDMEIITWVLSGELLHRDDTGSEGIIRRGEAQRMRAGSGIRHGEWNASTEHPVHLLQIWIEPNVLGLEPGHRQEVIDLSQASGRWLNVAGGSDAPLDLMAEARVLVSAGAGSSPVHIREGRSWWIHLAEGSGRILDRDLQAGDGIAIDGPWEGALQLDADSHALAFDLG